MNLYSMRDFKSLGKLVSYIQRYPHLLYRNVPKQVRQSSVGAIFRLNPPNILTQIPQKTIIDSCHPYSAELFTKSLNEIEKLSKATLPRIELLFIKRAVSPKDCHSGQLSFPGGKLDGLENDYEGCVREVQEEVGLDLNDRESFAFLGKLPTNFFAYYRNDLKTMLSVNLFFMKDPEKPLHISPSEVDKAFWVPLEYFLEPLAENIEIIRHNKAPINFISRSEKKWDSIIWKSIFKNFKTVNLPSYRMPNGEILFGLTYTVIMHMLNLIVRDQTEQVNSSLLQMIDSIKNIEAIYEKDILGIKKALAEKIYYHQRVKQFFSDTKV